MMVRRLPNGDFYVSRRRWNRVCEVVLDDDFVFVVKPHRCSSLGWLGLGSLHFGKDFVGRRIRLKVEVLE